MQQILNGAVANNKQVTTGSKPDKPTPRQNHSQQAAERKPEIQTGASLFKSGPDKDKSQRNLRLYGPAWSVPVVSAASVRNQALNTDLVVYCQALMIKSSGSMLVEFPNLSLLSCSMLPATIHSLSTERTDHSLQAAAKLAVKIPTPADYRSKGTIPNNTPAQPRSSLNMCINIKA